MLTKEQQELKEGSIGGTVANVLMTDETGDELQHAYEVVAGITPEDDFTDNWPVNRGSHMEGFALDWHERKNGPLIERGRVVQHPKYAFIRVTLDCYRPTDRATLDYKDCGGFRKLRDILNSYSAQAVLQRWCRQADRCIILLSHGGSEPVEYPIEVDKAYEDELMERLQAFWMCVLTLTPPTPMKAVVPPDKWRRFEFDLIEPSQWPNWAGAMRPELEGWRENHDSAQAFEAAREAIKELLPADVGYVTLDGVLITRNRAGSVSIKRQ